MQYKDILNFQYIIEMVKFIFNHKANFRDLKRKRNIFLYAGDIPQNGFYSKFIGLSITKSNHKHIKHNLIDEIPLLDNCVDIFQSEDVFEHIEKDELPRIINEIYRILKPNGVFRLSLPDYECDVYKHRTISNEKGQIIFDPGGGGELVNGKVINGGHLWFPTYTEVKMILEKTHFKIVKFYHYYDEYGNGLTKIIDYSISHIMRTPDHDERVQDPYRPLSIVVDCIK